MTDPYGRDESRLVTFVRAGMISKFYRGTAGVLCDALLVNAFAALSREVGRPALISAVLDVLEAVCPTDSSGALII